MHACHTSATARAIAKGHPEKVNGDALRLLCAEPQCPVYFHGCEENFLFGLHIAPQKGKHRWIVAPMTVLAKKLHFQVFTDSKRGPLCVLLQPVLQPLSWLLLSDVLNNLLPGPLRSASLVPSALLRPAHKDATIFFYAVSLWIQTHFCIIIRVAWLAGLRMDPAALRAVPCRPLYILTVVVVTQFC